MAALCLAGPALAQAGRITGTVTSAEGARPLAGVQISVGSGAGNAVTGDDGRFNIPVQPGTYSVYASRIGFSRDSVSGVVVQAGQGTSVTFQLTAISLLQSVVVIGYGETTEKDRSASVTQVSEKDFNTGRVVSPEQLIQGKVAGVQVVENNEPGGGMTVRIRGGTSINASNDPLYVVDGIPLGAGGGLSAGRNPLNFLDPGDIESITVLRDAAAAAIYGSNGANGVVIITTKRGGRGPQVSFSSSTSTSRVTGGPTLLDAAQYRAAVQQYAPSIAGSLGNTSTNWLDLVEHDASGTENSLALAGKRQDMTYRLSMGYLDQGGVVSGTALKRFSAGLNYDDKMFNSRLDVRASLRGSRSLDRFTPGGVIGAATVFDPTQPVFTSAGDYYFYTRNGTVNNLAPDNPLAQLALISDRGTTYRSIGELEGKYSLPWLTGLALTARGSFDVTKADRTTFTPTTLGSQQGLTNPGAFSNWNGTRLGDGVDLFGNYRRSIGGLGSDLDVTAGYAYGYQRSDYPQFFVTGLSTNVLGPSGVPSSNLQAPSYFVDENKTASFFARANVNVKDRYVLMGSIRRDGSSVFGPENRWGTFPAAAFAWRLSQEPFMKILPNALDELKLRLSWGVNGNAAIGNYLFVSTYTVGDPRAQAQFGNQFITTIRPSGADPRIKWEQTRSTNLGLDFGLLSDRITGSIDAYTKKTSDLLFRVPVANGSNLSDFILTNIGSVRNRGLEFQVNARVLQGGKGALTWDANFNASTNSNRILQINPFGGSTQQILAGPFISGGVGTQVQVLTVGQPAYAYYVYRHKTQDGKPVADRDANGQQRPDTAMYVDINGDKKIDQNDRVPFHSPEPKWIFGHTSSLGYRNFDASFTARAYLGNYVYNNVASNLGHYSQLSNQTATNLHSSVLQYGFYNPQYFSDIYVEKASFLRLDNVTLGYTFRGLRQVQSLRLFGTVQNVNTWTGYGGVDPTAGINGIDNNLYPRSRTYLAGLNVGF